MICVNFLSYSFEEWWVYVGKSLLSFFCIYFLMSKSFKTIEFKLTNRRNTIRILYNKTYQQKTAINKIRISNLDFYVHFAGYIHLKFILSSIIRLIWNLVKANKLIDLSLQIRKVDSSRITWICQANILQPSISENLLWLSLYLTQKIVLNTSFSWGKKELNNLIANRLSSL